ncbi:MAG: flagellar FlbD family protein [Bacillota bacterium]
MIRVTRLNGHEMVLNADLIETVEATPDTVISLTTGRKILVREAPEEITRRVVAYRRAITGRGWRGTRRRKPSAGDGNARTGGDIWAG